MPTQDQKVPNNPISGKELGELIIHHTKKLVDQSKGKLEAAIREKLERDPLFSAMYIHPNVRIKTSYQLIWSNRNLPKDVSPSVEVEASEVFFVDAVEQSLLVGNPNLTRLDAGLPITITRVERPGVDQNFGKIANVELPINRNEYPKPEPPEETDKSDELAERLGINDKRRLGKERKA